MLQNLSHINITLAGKTIIFLGLTILVTVFSLYIYRRTNPVVSKFTKTILTTTRITVLFVLLLVLFEATLQLKLKQTIQPSLAIAVDNSASMNISDINGSRSKIVRQILTSHQLNDLKDRFSTSVYTFSSDALPFSFKDSLDFNGDLTNISSSLLSIRDKLLQENPGGIILISDGNYNAGVNPIKTAEELGVPIYPVGIGSSDPIADLSIMDIESNLFAYTNEPSPIKIKLRNIGLPQSSIPVSLSKNGTIVHSKTVSLAAGPSEATAELMYTPLEPGREKLTVSIPKQLQEQTSENNKKIIYINVLKSRLNVLVLSGLVSPDVSFLRRILSANQRFNTIVAVEKNDGSFYLNPEILNQIDKVDFFILFNFPTRNSQTLLLDQINKTLAQNAKPVLFLSGKTTDFSRLFLIEDFLPIRADNKTIRESQIYLKPSSIGLTHPIMQTNYQNQDDWSMLPPVFTNISALNYWPNCEILAMGVFSRTGTGQIPLILIRTNGLQQSAAILSYGNWRLDFLMAGIEQHENVYTNLINNLIRWLESNRSFKTVNLETDKRFYHFGDGVQIQVKVSDEDRKTRTDANVQLEVSGKDKKYYTLNTEQDYYKTQIFPQVPGDYTLTATAHTGSLFLGADTLQISVGDYSAELADIPQKKALLQGIAQISNGQYLSPDSLDLLKKINPGRIRESIVFRENELWNDKKILAILIVFLAVEWFIRKKKGMV
ncbi:VWA domain-containing protein [candidate division KSB1 bacterium]|nr:VWA domain-containing protein [candidate division KSB1 bacterium]